MAAKDTTDKKPGRAARGNKTEFVLSFPRDMAARELVEKAREKGVELSEAYVYKIRSASGTAREKKPRAARGGGGGGSKAEFVRALPDGISFADAEQRAKAAGIALTKAYFYVLRSEAKKERGGAPKRERTAAPAPRGRAPSLRLTSDDPHEAALLEAVRVLGIARARALLDAVQKLEQGR